ncbi:hypothetical protein KFE25_013625 [Diacronema lutheri]|uniref:Nucleotide-diphospho-sugar transferase domain-containing protein n=1 Tax=Diacronema lutheri TaxID=2081491 RepID=A0A8J5XUA9_DIALT|nr:hypothetical protein KFE25_013625 [Diacronema lutheri]
MFARLGPDLADRLIATRQSRRPWAAPAVVSGLLVLAYILVRSRGDASLELVAPTLRGAAQASDEPALAGSLQPTARDVTGEALNPSAAAARQQRAFFEPPRADAAACGYSGAALAALSPQLVRAHSRRGVLFGALATASMREMVINYAAHLAPLIGECAALVGFMDGAAAAADAAALALRLRAGGAVGSYATAEPAPAHGGQAGRWRHARDLFAAASAAGVDLVLSDVDVVWLRDPWAYLRAALAAEGGLDALISTDTTNDWVKPLPAHPRMPALPAELQLEAAEACGRSLNIGILVLRGALAGAALLVDEAVAAVDAMGPHDVDQGAINRRWKGEAKMRDWRQTRGLACAMLGGRAKMGVLPAAQFLSLLGFSVRRLHVLRWAEPFAVHATFLRTQQPAGKLMRLREEGLFLDPPSHYTSGNFLAYTPAVPLDALTQPPIARGAVPTRHMALVAAQIGQLREALALARVLGRALVLPRVRCACELGFGPGHVTERCDADSAIELPYDCPVDHWLSPPAWLALGWDHRERGFLENPRVPDDVVRSRAHARRCAHNQHGGCCLQTHYRASEAQLRAELGGCAARVLELGDVRGLFGGFDAPGADADFDKRLRGVISSWCCTTDAAYSSRGGLVPYALNNATAAPLPSG